MAKRAALISLGILALGMASAACLGPPVNADGFDAGVSEQRETQAVASAGGYFGRKPTPNGTGHLPPAGRPKAQPPPSDEG